MYEFVDRPLHTQETSVRLTVWAMRQWVQSARSGRCACRLISCAFTSARVPDATGPLLALMRVLIGNARTGLRLGALEGESIAEDEAVLLGALVAAAGGRQRDCRDVARLLVHADMVPALTAALLQLAHAFSRADMHLSPAAPPSVREG